MLKAPLSSGPVDDDKEKQNDVCCFPGVVAQMLQQVFYEKSDREKWSIDPQANVFFLVSQH